MDPFSITVGILSLLGGVKDAIKVVRKLIRLRDVPEEVLQLSNEVSHALATTTE